MKTPVRSCLAAAISAGLVLGGMSPAAFGASVVKPGAAPLAVRIGQAKDLTHIEFGSDPTLVKRDGAAVLLRFARGPSPALSTLKITPPRFVKAALVTPVAGGVELKVTPSEGAGFRLGKADGASFLNLFPVQPSGAPPVVEAPSPKDQAPAPRANPVPANGIVKMQPDLQGSAIALRFAWRAPLGAAVFRRGDAIWVIFDAKANLDVSAAPRGARQFQKMQAIEGADYSAVRITAPPTVMASANAVGGVWTITLGPAAAPSARVPLARDDAAGPAALTAQVAGSTGVFWLTDPVVGDKLAVVTALAPAKGLDQRRVLVDAALLATVQGLAIEPATEDLQVSTDGDTVRIGRPRGLALSPATAKARAIGAASPTLDLPAASSLPALIDYAAWSKVGDGGFYRRYQTLLDAASEEGAKGKGAGVSARLGLARFLVGSQLSFEAIGVLDLLAKTNQSMLGDAEFRGLRGAARAMAGRYKDAQADFSSPTLVDDPASALWRGYVAAKLGDNSGAREQFARGRSVLPLFAPLWRARFARMDAEAALASGDLGTARNELLLASNAGSPDPDDQQAIQLTQAKLSEADNNIDQALSLYDKASASSYGAVAAPAILRAIELRLAKGRLQPAAAVASLDSLRYRWRGDATELETVRALGHIYLQQGAWRQALETLRSAGQRSADQPASIAVANDLSTAFRALFLDGQADGMQPIQALALFYDFKDLTPIGADGDMMVRKMVKRLVSVDLLTQASELLKYQADERLNGVAKAEVSTDLAIIDLMDKRPEDALDALNNSRTTLLPSALNAQRRVVEARALMGLGRYDHALEILQGDKSADAADIRAEAQWKQKAWPQAAQLLEGQLADRWKSPQPLSAEEQGRLMRASIAYSLAGDDAALARLRARYAKLAEGSSAPDALRVALSGVADSALTAQDFARASTDAAAFAGWVANMKKRFGNQPTWLTGPAAPVQAQAQTKPAAPAKQAPKAPAKAPVRQAQAAPVKASAKKG